MPPSIEQLIEYNTQDVVKIIMEERGCDVAAAMDAFYASNLCVGLNDPATGLYLQGPAYLYALFCEAGG